MTVSPLPVSTSLFTTHNADETKRLGRKLGRFLKKGDVVLLLANLGAGKTTFVQGLIKSFDIREAALSPTFVIAQTLTGNTPVHHLDFYRLLPRDVLGFGIQDYLSGKGEIRPGVVLIEWAERCKEIWPPERLEIRMKIKPRSFAREILIRGRGRRFQSIVKRLGKNNEI